MSDKALTSSALRTELYWTKSPMWIGFLLREAEVLKRVTNFWESEIPWEEWEWEAWPSIRRWRSRSWTVLRRPTIPFRTKTKKRCPFHYRGLECKSRKSRNTWGNRQIWPWNTEWSRAKANRVLPREHTGHSKHPLPTTQEKTLHMDITSWPTLKSDWLYSLQPKMEKLYTVNKNKTRRLTVAQIMTPYFQIQT